MIVEFVNDDITVNAGQALPRGNQYEEDASCSPHFRKNKIYCIITVSQKLKKSFTLQYFFEKLITSDD